MPPQYTNEPSPSLKQILINRQLNRNRPSCLPCRERKVRCNKQNPCSTCSKRGHPDLCLYNGSASPKCHSHRAREIELPRPSPITLDIRSQHGETSVGQPSVPDVPSSPNADVQLPDSSILDENSLLDIAWLHGSAALEGPGRTAAFQSGILPLLGASPREQASDSYLDSRAALHQSFPDDQPMVELFEAYRVRFHPFHCITYNLNEVEQKLCIFMNDREANNLPQSLLDCQWLCLLHAILALGAQFSNFATERRSQVSQKHIKLSFESLRSTESLTQPSKLTIQTLLLLAIALQNDMRPQAAWVIGATTIRLAQCLGIHKASRRRSQSALSLQEASYLRKAILWQDSLLSLAFDRSPGSYDMDCKEDLPDLGIVSRSGGLDYRSAIHWLCHIALQCLLHKSTQRLTSHSWSLFHDMEAIDNALCAHLKDRSSCMSLQQIQEFFAFTLHKNFLVATLCRPLIAGVRRMSTDSPEEADVRSRYQKALRSSARAYVHLRSVANYSSRSWASVHNGLSSVLLLSLMKETRNTADTRKLQSKLIEALSEADGCEPSGGTALTAQQLSLAHRAALKAIQTLKRISDQDKDPEMHDDAFLNRSTEINTTLDSVEVSALGDDSNQLEFWNGEEWFESLNDNITTLGAFESILLDQCLGGMEDADLTS